jgi:hypothetical protein
MVVTDLSIATLSPFRNTHDPFSYVTAMHNEC